MAKKIVRLYVSSFIDVEVETNDFDSEHEMKEFFRLNASDFIDETLIMENLAQDLTDIDVLET